MPADRDLAVFYRSLAEMLRAGVVAGGALESCAHILPEAGAAARIVERGRPLSEAFAEFPHVFPADHVRLVQIAERSGTVDATLGDLADYAAEMIAARRTMVSGLTLPAFIVHFAALIAPVPGLVLGRLSVGGYLFNALAPLAMLWGAVGAVLLFARHASPETLDALLQRLPLVREAWRDLQRWRMASALRMMARTSLDVPSSLRFAAEVCSDAPLATALRHASEIAGQHGTPASATLQSSAVLPADVMALWRNAEITGGLDTMFGRLAARYAESFRERAQAIAVWFPRIAYLLAAVGGALQVLQLAGGYLGYLNDAAR